MEFESIFHRLKVCFPKPLEDRAVVCAAIRARTEFLDLRGQFPVTVLEDSDELKIVVLSDLPSERPRIVLGYTQTSHEA